MLRLFVHPFVFAAALCFALAASVSGQETVYLSAGAPEVPAWSNQAYPGWTNQTTGGLTHPPDMTGINGGLTSSALMNDRNGGRMSPALINSALINPALMSDVSGGLMPTTLIGQKPDNKRTGMFQKGTFNTLWVPESGSRGLGMTELDLSAVFALPMPTPTSPLLITPSFKTTFFNADNENKTFYSTGVNLRWIRPIAKDKFTADLGFGIFYNGDFHAKAGDAVRLPLHVAGIWHVNPRTKFIFGVAYQDRHDSDWNWLPLVGLLWNPNEDISVELVIPRLRVAQRLRWFGSSVGDEQSDWIYAALEFGGGSWGTEWGGTWNYRDYRLLVGYERRTRFGWTLGLEAGYMFERDIRHTGFDPSDAFFLRLRTTF